ncbi:MAG TPA: 3-oxoadipyl-CoA thiolase [Burkholderiaceae bacterium]|nr:3-oxoadipyl-CoA thiolase [Burkholderiaceae bacterium]
MNEVYLCDGVRTPFGRYGGALSGVRVDDLAALPLKALLARNANVDWAALDDVYYGCANQAGEDNRNVARMAALLAGLPTDVPAATINRLCGSSMDAVGICARAIRAGEAEMMIAGGVEGMSRAPFVMPKADSAFSRSNSVFDTTLGWRFVNKQMKTQYGIDSMPETAENVATDFGVARTDQDAFALRSQQRYSAGRANGFFNGEIIPVPVAGKKGDTVVDQDEHPRETTLDSLAKLKGVVKPEGTVTAGNASGINDGAVALLIAGEQAVGEYGLTPMARLRGVATAGVPPRIMGIGPAPATQKLLARHALKISDIDVVELNEAFAAQALAVTRQLALPDDAAHVNPNGGAIAIGHPLGASGARLVLTAARQLKAVGGRYAVATMCIGVGQGIALLVERV